MAGQGSLSTSIQQFTRAPNEVAGTKWFGEKCLDMESGRVLSNRRLVARGEHNDGNLAARFLSTNLAERFYPVHARHRIIEQHEIRLIRLEVFHGVVAACDAVDRCRNRLEGELQQSKHVDLVINQQNLILHPDGALVIPNNGDERSVVGGQAVIREVIDRIQNSLDDISC
jgi:hypothetical protein